MNKEWKPIPGIEGYEASDDGQIRSVSRVTIRSNGTRLSVRGCTLKPVANPRTRYLMVQCGRGPNRCRYVHDLVLRAFHGERPEGCTASHLNGDRSDNRAENLAWESHKANCKRKSDHGTQVKGGAHYLAKLDAKAVLQMRSQYTGKYGEIRQIARTYGVADKTAGDAIKGKTWSHL